MFPFTGEAASTVDASNEALDEYTEVGNMDYLWTLFTSTAVAVGAGIAIGWLTHSGLTPVAISVFSSVFWVSYIQTNSILSVGGYVPSGFLVIFFVGVVFVFIAAIINLATGVN